MMSQVPTRLLPLRYREWLFQFAAIVALTGIALGIRNVLDPVFGDLYPFPAALLAILVSAVYFGLWPGLFAAILNVTAVVYFFVPPRWAFGAEDSAQAIGQSFHLIIGIGMAILGGRLRDERDRVTKEKARLLAVVNTALDGILAIDSHGTIESINPTAERLFGYAPNEAVGRHVTMLMPEAQRSELDGYLRNYDRARASGILGEGRELRGRRKNGQEFPMYLAISEFTLDDERHFTAVLRDLTARQSLEEQCHADRRTDHTRNNGCRLDGSRPTTR